MWAALPEVIARLEADAPIRVVALRGAGGNFAAGADIAEFAEVYGTRESALDYAALMAGAMDAISGCGKPVLAAIEGLCIGGGVALALACDIRFADARASFAITPAKLGIAYCFADTHRLVQSVGAAAARDLLFSGRRIDAEAALRINLVDQLCAAGTLDATVQDYATMLSANSAETIKVAKSFVARSLAGQTSEDDLTRKAYCDILEKPDFAEGRGAFLDKRPARFE
jgi:enoyl-CoA hydratase/carnithine racemase